LHDYYGSFEVLEKQLFEDLKNGRVQGAEKARRFLYKLEIMRSLMEDL
jgi:hypothetical protein